MAEQAIEPASTEQAAGGAAVVQDSPALSLKWICGFSKDVVNGVHHLGGTEIFYPAANTGVIYDTQSGTQKLLQGHTQPISATFLSADKKWIVTADTGPDSMLTIWDRSTGTPVKIMFSPYKNGITALDMTPDSRYLATLSSPDHDGEEMKQYLSIWDWTAENSTAPLCTALIGTQDIQTCVVFNKWDWHEVATNGKRRVFFWNWKDSSSFQFYSPALAAKDFKQKVGDFTQTIFLPESSQAATATADGDVVIWDLSLIVDDLSRPDERRAVKILRLIGPDVGLSVFFVLGNFVVAGSSDGAVRFYDYQFRLQAWFEDLSAGSVTSVSFDHANGVDGSLMAGSSSQNASSNGDFQFQCPNFIVGTASALVVACRSDLFFELEPQQRRGKLVLQGLDSPVYGMSCHPSEPLVAVSGLSGFIHLWNYKSKTLQTVKIFEKILPQLLEYSPSGLLSVGFTNGQIRILNSELGEMAQFRECREPVTHLAFSTCSQFLAVAHADRSVWMYRYDFTRAGDTKAWMSAGKHKSHWKNVVGLTFSGSGPASSSGHLPTGSSKGAPRLYSLGEDRKLVEYECPMAADYPDEEHVGFPILSSTVVEQEAVPTGLTYLAAANTATEGGSSSSTAAAAGGGGGAAGGAQLSGSLVVSTTEYKFKTYKNRICRRTSLAPTYGGPISRMLSIKKSGKQDEESFLLYTTKEKVIGLLQQPLDGNPFRQMGVIAHPSSISAIAVDPHGKYAFSLGGEDLTMNMWELDTETLSTAVLRGGNEPYLKLIEPDLLSEIRDYFYYCQIRSHGERTTSKYVLDGTIPLSEIPYLMCALGCFPSQVEIQNMISEVKSKNFEVTGKSEDKINFDDFLQLYVNHRPVFQVDNAKLEHAVAVASGGGNKRELIAHLVGACEEFTEEELEQCLKALTGAPSLQEALPDDVDSTHFVEEVLGFQMVDE
mmetsp:Transcript_6084/g.15041  ORF Transcript_6084/g.15041 Transcript_6084/m.15041 type:complete len:941 (+) Transcript_6084:536-3358(+)|eukprot:CAMPEP_0178993190 /NCGR_PEP_ID=MMETSP0795-20121207/6564_1 /TAXON_ID=88552 /ORGANISM="Amoebophrya sp., Strain Ameob2" /LENGTH=940 /DNA_ID=CAMNT_0020685219 /DNA_START=496 /DNA_END=3318 /DNA_ORIENTATION=+